MADDYFALLGEPRRPWLDPEWVKDRFHALSRERHPDQQTQGSSDGAFVRLNAAQATLRDPKARLRHLLELEYPHVRLAGPAEVPPSLADLFAPLHGLLRDIDAFLARKNGAPSALARALLAREELRWQEATQTRLGELEVLQARAVEDLQTFDAHWEPRPANAAVRLHGLYQRFAYLSRWTEQLRERQFLLL